MIMKNKFLLMTLALAIFSTVAIAGKTKETTKVYGVCGMCKSRIEKAAKEAGASSASWDEDSQMLTVSFSKKKTNMDQIQQKIASVGHDSEKFKAPDDVYNKLPECCLYDRTGKKTEHKHD
jgi:hypothetical protein